MAATTQPPQLFQGIARQSAGYKLLASMGWKEGEGLGASKQGIKEHVKVKKKQDAQGIGAFEAHHSRDWAVGMVSFDRILASLKEVKASSKVAEEQDDEEEKEAPPAAALTGKKLKKQQKQQQQQQQEQAQRNKKQKRKAAEDSGSDDSDAARRASGAAAGTSSPSSSEGTPAAAGQQEPAPKRVKLATHLGRYGKRERAKFVKNYSEQDLKMILGAVPGAIPGVEEGDVPGPNGAPAAAAAGPADGAFWPVLAEIKARPQASGSESDAEDVARPPTPRLQGEARSPPDGEHQAKAAGCSGSGAKDSETTKTTFWWSSMFVRAGKMGSIRQELKSHTVRAAEGVAGAGKAAGAIQVHGFKEEDQTKLYEQVQNNATTGKQGLGRSSAPKKVAGARWCGTKTKIVDSDDDEEEQEEQEAGEADGSASDEEAEATTVVVMAPKHVQQQQQEQQRQQQQQQQQKAQQQGGGGAEDGAGGKRSKAAAATDGGKAVAATDGGKKVKWHKLVEQILKDAPKRRLKLKKLQKKALSAAGLLGAGASGDDADAAVKSMLKKIQKSGKFQTCEKWVSLL